MQPFQHAQGQSLCLSEEELPNPSIIFPVLPADDSKQAKKHHGFEEVGQWWKWVSKKLLQNETTFSCQNPCAATTYFLKF